MADTILKLKEIEDLFQNITTKMLGYDPLLPANQNKVRIAWPTKGAPAWKITEDIAFLRINNPDDPIIRQRDVAYNSKDVDNANQVTSYTRVHTVKWLFYGPNSYDNAETVRNAIFIPEYREQFNKKNLYLILDVMATARFPELFNGQWWERSDFTASFNELVRREATVPYLQSINIITKKG